MQVRDQAKITPAEQTRVTRLLAVLYLAGGALSVAISFLPLMHRDSRSLGLGGFFVVLGILHLAGAHYASRHRQSGSASGSTSVAPDEHAAGG